MKAGADDLGNMGGPLTLIVVPAGYDDDAASDIRCRVLGFQRAIGRWLCCAGRDSRRADHEAQCMRTCGCTELVPSLADVSRAGAVNRGTPRMSTGDDLAELLGAVL